jgi:hypothetical protein
VPQAYLGWMTSGALNQPIPVASADPVERRAERAQVLFRPPGTRLPATDGERRALASVLRLRILRMCLYEELTNKEIAGRLQRDPATVLHHVRTLVTHEFLRAGDPRSGPRGSREVPYRATGKSWELDFGDPSGQRESAGVTSSSLANTMVRTFVEEVSEVPESSVRTSRLGLQLSPDHYEELAKRISDVLDEFAGRPQDPDGNRWSLFIAMHPEPGQREQRP